MDEIRFVAGPIVARYMDKVEEDRQAVLKVEEEKAAKKKAEIEARKKAEEESKKSSDAAKAKENGASGSASGSGTATPQTGDSEMKDASNGPVKPDGIEEAGEDKK